MKHKFDSKWLKHRSFTWDSNQGQKDGKRRWIHWAMAAPLLFQFLCMAVIEWMMWRDVKWQVSETFNLELRLEEKHFSAILDVPFCAKYFLMDHSWPLFLYFVLSIKLIANRIAEDWIRTAEATALSTPPQPLPIVQQTFIRKNFDWENAIIWNIMALIGDRHLSGISSPGFGQNQVAISINFGVIYSEIRNSDWF